MVLRIKITREQIIGFTSLLLLFLVGIYLYLNFYPVRTVVIDGTPITFRQNIKEAKNVLVFPNEDEIFNKLFNTAVINITFVFKDAGERENPYYILQEVEIINKLTFAYARLNRKVNFNAMPIETYENLRGTIYNPIIALIHPIYANETFVMVKDNVIFISGKNYKDFDLATIRFLSIALNIKI
ncbi:MAG: hypothetical protein QXQ18_00425 [Candidatus Aenigmatarchaeota archaeon]